MVRQAERSEVWEEWKTTMEAEINSLEAHGMFEVIPRVAVTSPVIPLKWVFDNKVAVSGNITQRKAQIVARNITSLCHALAPTTSYCGPRDESYELPRASAYSLAHEFDTASPALRNAQRNENK
ncbi:hypothetical protein AURDEDRAFT_176593 [Auricularia subglabra TFB-10046 SS5]|uniref:Reverse transcriptase Ty1/copia-type domain-containing protein n=1 Tax=Auricularia subglabra (strain TFB-10046 / SS5) TaxID=717982 RepID=J0CVB8_AURST|nr:hypothetical protein AURDEDRAFT_176593 [Auricularia subglabra TFB-10046 SS5]